MIFHDDLERASFVFVFISSSSNCPLSLMVVLMISMFLSLCRYFEMKSRVLLCFFHRFTTSFLTGRERDVIFHGIFMI